MLWWLGDVLMKCVCCFQVQEYEHVGYVPLSSTTTPDVPNLFRQALRLRGDIDEKATDYLPAEKATRELEREVRRAPHNNKK